MVEPVTVITATATAIATLIGKKAVEKLGESLGSEVSKKIGEIVSTVRAKFKKIGMEGVLTQVETNPTQPNRQFFQQALEMQMGADTEFAETLIR